MLQKENNMSIPQENVDLIDSLLKLNPDNSTAKARNFRDEVLLGTQASYDAIFGEELSLPLTTRWLVAIYASKLSEAEELTEHYLKQARITQIPNDWIKAILIDNLSLLPDPTIKAILTFTRTLTLNPIAGDKKALLDLKKSGVSIPDCIALAQLIAFLSYQIRLVSGLKAMQSLEKSL